MNTAVGDSFDIGWKLAAVLLGYGGPKLLQSYEDERRPVAARNLMRSGEHWQTHSVYWDMIRETGDTVLKPGPEGDALRKRIHEHIQENDGENKDFGIELGYRYNGSPVIVPDREKTEEPEFKHRSYVPSTWPGARAPHVYLKNGKTSIFDLFGTGRDFSIVDFTTGGDYAKIFKLVAQEMGMPLKAVHLPDETHVRKIWERDAVLVRPDDHVAWRASTYEELKALDVKAIFSTILGTGSASGTTNGAAGHRVTEEVFVGTIGNVDQDKVEHLAAFQQ
jgi:hypothetical protein